MSGKNAGACYEAREWPEMISEIANEERKERNLVVNVVDCVDIGARKKVYSI